MFLKAPSSEDPGMGASWKLTSFFNNENTLLAFIVKIDWLLLIQIFESLVSWCSVWPQHQHLHLFVFFLLKSSYKNSVK